MKNLKVELTNKEMSFIDLDNKMITAGYCTEMDNGIAEHIKESGSVTYTKVDDEEPSVEIFFDVIVDTEEDEAPDCFVMRINGVEAF